ncbi:MAG: recombinase family protein [Butyricicoccus sp.]|nr:recombinase family protein [Butyricicoccus sp.]
MDAIYARQSIDKKDSLSIEGQIEYCRKYANENYRVFQDKGFSGKNTKRPAFTELMQAVEAGQIKKVYVYRLDRFSRSIADFSRLWEVFQKYGVEFLSVTENFDTSSPIGRAMLNIVLVFAQLERETTAERVKDNYIHRFSLGAWPGGPAPYGFDLIKVTDNERRVSSLRANGQASIVRKIFEEYARPEVSLRSIARDLTAQGIHGPKREAWDNVTLSRLLHSPLYVCADEDVYLHYLAMGMQIQQPLEAFDGVHACNVIGRRDRSRNKYNSLEGQQLTVANHGGIIDSGLWLRVQEKLAKNPQISHANAGKYSWLTGLMKCNKCGYAVKINYSKPDKRFYLICSGRSNLANCDAAIHIDLRELEQQIAAQIKDVLSDCPAEDIGTDNQEISEALLAVEQKIERLVNALAESSEISAVYISRQIDKLHKQRETLLTQSTAPAPCSKRLDFDAASFEEKKLIASEFIERILLEDNRVNIIWKI